MSDADMNRKFIEMMELMQKQMAEQAKKHEETIAVLTKAVAEKSQIDSSLGTSNGLTVSQSQLMNDIGGRISVFQFDLETEKTFSKWYARYSTAFTEEGKGLDDKNRVALLVSKLSEEVYEQYSRRICPKLHHEVDFKDTVDILKEMFDIKKSLFSHRFACINIARDGDSPVEYTNKVNALCELAMLKDIDPDGWKVFFWLRGLDPAQDTKTRAYFLKYVEKKTELGEKVNINELCTEWQKIQSQTSAVSEMEKSDTAVRAVYAKKPSNQKQNSSKNTAKHESSQGERCWNCGKSGHKKPECSQPLTKCFKCQRSGHMSSFCKAKKSSSYKKTQNVAIVGGASSEDAEVNSVRQYVSVDVNSESVEFQLDTGSDITLIGREDWTRIGKPDLEKCTSKVKSASGNELKLLGRALVDFRLKGSVGSGYVYVREHGNLLGLDWIGKSEEMSYHMGMMVNELTRSNTDSIHAELKEKFPEVFREGLGRCVKEKAVLTVQKNATPVFRPKRPVAYGATEVVEKELDRLENLGVLKKVNHSRWAAPLVVVKKAGGDLRVCADFKTGLNTALEDEDHPIPAPEDVFATLNGGKLFSTVDLKDAYLQIELSDDSKALCTVNTHRGLYEYQRLPFGAKTAPMVFQRIMDKMITGLKGVTAYLDDIIIVGSTEKEHTENLLELFKRISEYGFRVKLEKCKFLEKKIKFLGFIVDKDGRRPDEAKVAPIKGMKEPVNQKELKSFMGMITYYSAFIPHMKSLRGPLDKLLIKDVEWKWSKLEAEAFQKLKDILSSDLNLTHFLPNVPIVVAADACDYGIGAVISHRFPDGTEKPISHAARSLNSAEKNYSQIEKEGLGLIFAVKRFHKFLFGRKFLLRTDHKPLLSIFGSKKGIPVHSQNRLVRWSTILLAYDFDIEYIKTDDFGQADALSRMIQKMPNEHEDVVIAQVEVDVEETLRSAIRKLPVRVRDIQEETKKSKMLQNVMKYVSRGIWPKKIDEKLKKFYSVKGSFSVVQDCLMMSDRVVVPESLQRAVLKQLHEGHPGMVRMKQLARSFVYWPKIDEDVEKVVSACTICQVHGKTPKKVPLQPWKTPERVWQRVHIDYAGPENGQYYLVAVDAKSKWAEVKIVKSISAVSTVGTLKDMFSQHGYPETLVSDNGTQFVSKEFATMCQDAGIEHVRSPAFHPQSNGQAERFVDTLKRGLKKLKGEGSVNNEILSQFLLHYRSTPSNALGGLTPAEVHLGRRLRTRLSLMMPQLNKTVDSEQVAMKEQFDKHHGVKARSYRKGDSVFVKVFEKNTWSWKPGKVNQRQGRVVYVIGLNDGRERVVHANQMKMRLEESTQEQNKEHEWATTMFDVFELPTGWSARKSTDEAKRDNATSTPVMDSPQQVHQGQGTTPSPVQQVQSRASTQQSSSQSTTTAVQGQRLAPSPVQPRRTTRVRKNVVKYDPSSHI
ncbi:hypothetical protein CRE_08209 [Caenorhabditis remanei]|uniref:RNA-directed DNA polymerase n=1 Tax=Caenorhabditis remanei TaxID=31234 RepID=E3M325_CAERE|nr:hypothetical protein CRE_08209 [Caenorhabditis remanei]